MPAGLYATPVGVNVAPSLITVAPYRTFSKTIHCLCWTFGSARIVKKTRCRTAHVPAMQNMVARLKHLFMIREHLLNGFVSVCDLQILMYKVQARISRAACFAALEDHGKAMMLLESTSYKHA